MADLDFIKKNYAQLSNEKIIHLANFEAHQLRPEVVDILLAEIKKRNLDDALTDAVKVSTAELSEEELKFYISLMQNLPDPTSGETGRKLNATIISSTYSMIFFSKKTDNLFIGNQTSIQKKLEECTQSTAVAGWWGIPWGIINSISSIRNNIKMGKINYNDKPTDLFIEYVKNNIGYIESNKDNPGALLSLFYQK